MKNLIKSVIKYRNNIKDKNRKDLKEISTFLIKNLLITHEINQKVTEEKIFTMLEDFKGTSHVESLKIIESVFETIHLSGDVCEFGVAQGKTSKLISYLIMNTQKNIYLYDSFEGLPKPGVKDKLKDDIFNLGKMEAYEGKMSHNEKKVLEELSSIKFDLNRLKLNKGFFNQKNMPLFNFPKTISFAYIDFDFYQPTIDVLKKIENLLIVGSIIIVDDYDFFSTGAKTAVDEWYDDKNNLFKLTKIKTLNASFVIIKKIK
jgi:O-methyltransferase